MFKIYRSGNYIIAEKGGKVYEYAISKTVYTFDNAGKYEVTETGVGSDAAGTIPILTADVDAGNWENDLAVAYTQATLLTFLRENTGFNTASGGSGAPQLVVDISAAQILNWGTTPIELAALSGPQKYYKNVKILLEYTFGTIKYLIELPDFLVVQSGSAKAIIEDEFLKKVFNTIAPVEGLSKSNQLDTIGGVTFQQGNTYNKNIVLFSATGQNPTQGDGTIRAKIWYEIETFG